VAADSGASAGHFPAASTQQATPLFESGKGGISQLCVARTHAVHHCEIMPTIESAPSSPRKDLSLAAPLPDSQIHATTPRTSGLIQAFFGRRTAQSAAGSALTATGHSRVTEPAPGAAPYRVPGRSAKADAAPWHGGSGRASAYLADPALDTSASQSQRTSASHTGGPRSTVSSIFGSVVLPIPQWLKGPDVIVPQPDHRPAKFAALASCDAPLSPAIAAVAPTAVEAGTPGQPAEASSKHALHAVAAGEAPAGVGMVGRLKALVAATFWRAHHLAPYNSEVKAEVSGSAHAGPSNAAGPSADCPAQSKVGSLASKLRALVAPAAVHRQKLAVYQSQASDSCGGAVADASTCAEQQSGARPSRRVSMPCAAAIMVALLLAAVLCIVLPIATSRGGSDASSEVVEVFGTGDARMVWVQPQDRSTVSELLASSTQGSATLARWPVSAAPSVTARALLTMLTENDTDVVRALYSTCQ
jgi:hypothetical protein